MTVIETTEFLRGLIFCAVFFVCVSVLAWQAISSYLFSTYPAQFILSCSVDREEV